MATPVGRFSSIILLCLAALASRGHAAPARQALVIPMRDGAGLAADLDLPVDYSAGQYPEGVPAILAITPYDKNRDQATGAWRDFFTAHGYAFVVQDMRGFYASAGAGRGAPRHYDGYDTVEWLAAQSWCNGRLGMIGYSHLGAIQYETAILAPPHLACAIPAQAPGNYYTNALFPPVFRKADTETILRGPFTAATARLVERRVRTRAENRLGQFNTPMIHSAGWYDFYTEGAVEMFRALRAHGGPGARGSQKLLIGPWGHGIAQEENPGQPLRLEGGLAYPPGAKPGWGGEIWLPWFDYWCKDRQTGVMSAPAVKYYLMGDPNNPKAPGNAWIEADDFPPATDAVAYYLHPGGTLVPEKPAVENSRLDYRFDPADPVPTVGRTHWRIPVRGPFDQRAVENRPDVLVFSTAVLETPLIVVGGIRVLLWASSDRPDTDFIVKLTDVYPDGRSMLFAYGLVRARYRNTFLAEEPLVPGEPCEFDIDLGFTALALAPGHRLRLAVSSSDFDRFDLNPNTGEPYGDHEITRRLLVERLRADPAGGEPAAREAAIALNSVYLDAQRPSRVILPVAGSLEELAPRRD